MTTFNSSHSRIIAVWLVLLAMLACMMVPSVALAKKEMTIATEGDPGDGLGATGGGSGSILDQGTGDNSQNIIDDRYWIADSPNYQVFGSFYFPFKIHVYAISEMGKEKFVFEFFEISNLGACK